MATPYDPNGAHSAKSNVGVQRTQSKLKKTERDYAEDELKFSRRSLDEALDKLDPETRMDILCCLLQHAMAHSRVAKTRRRLM